MLPFFRKKGVSSGPHEFGAEIEIERPASEVYALLDLADARHAKRQLGERVEEIAGKPGRFDLAMADLPGAVFALTVTPERRDLEYGFSCESTPTFGRVARSHEHYALENLGQEGCRLVLTNTVEFIGPLSEDEYAMEAMMLSFACFNALAKIKVHAEEGVEAVRAMTAAQMAGFDGLDCRSG
jgi:hypothetical protein